MPRNQETIRQWHVLRALAGARLGIGVDTLATEQGVTPRTIRRDFRALQEAGFPLYQEHRDAGLVWKIEPRALRGLDSSFDVDPYRIVYAEGGLYLSAYVPEYCEVRTFAVERIHRLALREEHFPEPQTPTALFPHSLGVHSGTPERVEIEFEARVAHRIAEP